MPIVAAFATSHAYTSQEPETWDKRRERSKANVARKAGRPGDELLALVKQDIPRFRKIIQEVGIQPE